MTQRDLLRQAQPAHCSRITVGEVRGEEGLTLLLLMNTGHGGTISTAHANGALDALQRVAVLCQMAPDCSPWEALRRSIGRNVRTVAHLSQGCDGSRCVAEAIHVKGYVTGPLRLEGEDLSVRIEHLAHLR